MSNRLRVLNKVCKCGAPTERYVYPLPGSSNPWEGAMMCAKCAAEAEAELKKLGHFGNGHDLYPIENEAPAITGEGNRAKV